VKHLTIQKRGDGGNHHPQVISGKRKDINTKILVREVVIIERSYIAPVCNQCGSFKNLVPFRVSGKRGASYKWRWVCSNHDGEGNCPAYELDGKQVIDIEGVNGK